MSYCKIIVAVFFLSINFIFSAHSQRKGLLKESIKQVSDDGITWKNQNKYNQAYDAYGNQVLEEYYNWDSGKSGWKLQYNTRSEFNQEGLLSKLVHTVYDQDSGKPRSETRDRYTYYNGLPISSYHYNKDYENKSDYSETKKMTYDEQGRRIKLEVIQTENGEVIFTSKQQDEYNNDGCLVSRTDISSNGSSSIKEIWEIEISNNSECQPVETITTDKNGAVISRRKWVREYDDQGNEVHIVEFHSASAASSDLYLYSETWNTYENNLLVERIVNQRNGTGRFLIGYDSKSRQISRKQQAYDSLSGEWINIHSDSTLYDDAGRVIYYGYQNYAHSEEDSLFAEKYSQQFFYNETGFEYKDVYHFEGYRAVTADDHLETVKLNTTETYDYSDRCDGVPSVLNVYFEDTGQRSLVNYSRENYTYYDLAACEAISDPPEPLVIFPNPASGYFNIYNNVFLENAGLEIINRDGRVVLKKQLSFSNYVPVDIQGLPPGLYIVKIKSDVNNITGRLIIN